MKSLTEAHGASPAGLYLHIPFCAKKCAYCDFYSAVTSDGMLGNYTARLISAVKQWGGDFHRPINTVYLGGGTPSLLKERLFPLLAAVQESFKILPGAEVTLEANPEGITEELLSIAAGAGINRLSIGVQSGNNTELKALGRRHTAEDAASAVRLARRAGFSNISLDLMLGLPGSDNSTLVQSLDFILSLHPEHISAYILKIEPDTALAARENLALPDDDRTAEQYLFVCERLESAGYGHYEISNFAVPGKESRHNLKYWSCEEYLGIGPSAHSFLGGRRFYYPRDLKAFLAGNAPLPDGEGGGAEEYIMLRLRLAEGLSFAEFERCCGKKLPEGFYEKCLPLEKAGLLKLTDSAVSLTERGMLVSNSIISELIF